MCTAVRWIFVHAHPPPLTHPPLFLTSPTLTPTGDTRGCGCRGHGCNFPDGRSLFETTAGAAVQGGGCRGDRSTRPPTSHGGEERRVGIGGRRTGEGKGEWQGGGCRGDGSARPAASYGGEEEGEGGRKREATGGGHRGDRPTLSTTSRGGEEKGAEEGKTWGEGKGEGKEADAEGAGQLVLPQVMEVR